MKLIFRIVITSASVLIAAWAISGIVVTDFKTALLVAVVIGIINITLKPIAKILTLPINLLTFGLFSLVINALVLLLASAVVEGFIVEGFITALLGGIIVSFTSSIGESLLGIS